MCILITPHRPPTITSLCWNYPPLYTPHTSFCARLIHTPLSPNPIDSLTSSGRED